MPTMGYGLKSGLDIAIISTRIGRVLTTWLIGPIGPKCHDALLAVVASGPNHMIQKLNQQE
jgi:hypothetical protein